jgi:AraC-like DNA-binding protein
LYGLFKKNEAVKRYLRPFYRQDVSPDCFFLENDCEVSRVLDIFSGDSPCKELETVSAIAGMFAWLIKEKRFTDAPSKTRWSYRIKPVLEYIEAHYSEPLSLDTLASVAGMNSRYFCRVFYSLTNSTPINYLNFYRIEHAAYLIESTDLPITDIASECGFWESSYFTKVFKKYKNTTPQKYRQDNKRRSNYEA